MALHHAASGEIVDIRPLGKKLKEAISVTLVKTPHLQVFRYILLKSNEFAEHKVHGEITVQCLEGVVEFTSQGRKQMLRAGEFVYLAGGDQHALKGMEDASVLVTIVSNK
ncbi:MAG: cupin domain-containing protein [Sulfuricaulis sp.]|uniref:cupin domain-containing protein n=1 Tax=Sulfuricaulis sp. TaxID=2003553 RepID=UPI0025FC40E9|nr:cupin domain-containing protein [Sulfuricaulis sp.]MCR4345944.1 cupin domain-containing protein [Sulfuricaulis sp.]